MTYTVVFRQAATRDIERTLDWYGQRAPEQVDRLVSEIEILVGRIRAYPLSFRVVAHGARCAMLKVFPYKVWYRCLDEHNVIEVLAVFHARQDAEPLDDRLW